MAHLRAIFRGLAGTGIALPELVAAANGLFRESTLAPYIATLAVARAGADGTLEIVNAGHCLPLVMGPSGIEEIAPTGLPLGISGTVPYSSRSIRLAPGGSLVFYSDGITEALDGAGNQYGDERLLAALGRGTGLPPQGIVAALLDDLAGFLGGAPRTDDRTLLVARWRG